MERQEHTEGKNSDLEKFSEMLVFMIKAVTVQKSRLLQVATVERMNPRTITATARFSTFMFNVRISLFPVITILINIIDLIGMQPVGDKIMNLRGHHIIWQL